MAWVPDGYILNNESLFMNFAYMHLHVATVDCMLTLRGSTTTVSKIDFHIDRVVITN